jgi:hypothetical protein
MLCFLTNLKEFGIQYKQSFMKIGRIGSSTYFSHDCRQNRQNRQGTELEFGIWNLGFGFWILEFGI